MKVRGTVQNGVVVMEGPLPERTRVTVAVVPAEKEPELPLECDLDENGETLPDRFLGTPPSRQPERQRLITPRTKYVIVTTRSTR